MKKLLLAAVMLFSVGQIWGGDPFAGFEGFSFGRNNNKASCLPSGTSFSDQNAAKWASYDHCMSTAMCGMARPMVSRNSSKLGPGNPKYEQYKKCAEQQGVKPRSHIYHSSGF